MRLSRVRALVEGRSALPPTAYREPVEFAVLVALFEEAGAARVLLTRRASHLRRNQGEVAFPGGRLEEGETSVEAALREAFEEVALEPSSVEIVGELAPLSTISKPSFIQPVVGILSGRPTVRANPDEVSEIFDVGLSELAAPGVFREETWAAPDGSSLPIYFYDVCDPPVWGATAKVLKELLDLLGGGRPAD